VTGPNLDQAAAWTRSRDRESARREQQHGSVELTPSARSPFA